MEANPYKKAMAIAVIALLFGIYALGIISEMTPTTTLPADNITIVDNLGNYTSDNVEGALQEIGNMKVGSEIVARDIYVVENLTTGDNDGTSWANAYQNIQGLRDAVADIKGIVDGCVITVNLRGDFDNWYEEEPAVTIEKIMINGGYIEFVADDYILAGVVTASGNNSVTITTDDKPLNYWENCYMTVNQWGTGLGVRSGEVRRIDASSSAGGETWLHTVDAWDLNPAVNETVHVAGRARFNYAPFGFGVFTVAGKNNVVRFKGIAFVESSAEEGILDLSAGMSYLEACCFYNNGAGYDIMLRQGASIYMTSTGFHGGGGGTYAGVYGYGCQSGYISGCIFDSSAGYAILMDVASRCDIWYGRFHNVAGDADIFAARNSVLWVLNSEGQDAATYGIRAVTGAQVLYDGAEKAISASADAATFAYILDV